MRGKKDAVVLIGMPGCGKSTIGVVLAKMMGYEFVDSDLEIQKREGKLLSEIIEEKGNAAFRKIEEKVNCKISVKHSVLATGGSAVYGERAMRRLSEHALVVYIKLPFETIERRVGSLEERGVSLSEGQSLEQLFNERSPLYEKYSDIVVETAGLRISEAIKKVKEAVDMLRYKELS